MEPLNIDHVAASQSALDAVSVLGPAVCRSFCSLCGKTHKGKLVGGAQGDAAVLRAAEHLHAAVLHLQEQDSATN